jgi:putative ABC transport system permease protein
MTGLLVLSLTITLFLPLVTFLAVDQVNRHLYARSRTTPILVGSKGSPFLLTFNSLYYKTSVTEPLCFSAYEQLKENLDGAVIPLHTFHTVRGIPVVGTSFDYFAFRNLEPAQGTLPRMLGDAVLGAEAARRLKARVKGSVISDATSIYDISAEYPLKMRITGILAPTGTPDDNVVFVDLKTAWVIDGICHGHENLAGPEADLADPGQNPDDAVLFIEASEVVYNSLLKKYNEITPENVHTFHFHGDQGAFPLSAVIAVPATYREEVMDLLTRLNLTRDLQAVRPSEKVEEILNILLDVKRIFDAFSVLVLVSTAAFLVLVVSLQIRQRRGERLILYRIGGGRHTVQALLGIELLLLFLMSLALAVLLSLGALAVIRAYITG